VGAEEREAEEDVASVGNGGPTATPTAREAEEGPLRQTRTAPITGKHVKIALGFDPR